MPPGRSAMPAVRALIDALADRLRRPDAWD